MKRIPAPRLLLCLTVFAFATRLALAQVLPAFSPGETAIITMKSGDKFEGKVLRDASDSVEIEYHLTPKIIDKKVLLKSDIATVKKQRPSETEFAARGLAKLLPTPDLKDASYYESTIQDQLRTFIAKYPGTPEATEVEKIVKTLGEEKSKVLSGQLKVEGQWLDAAAVKRDTYNIEAYRQLLLMREKAAENKDTRYLAALRVFEKLRTDYPVSPNFLKAIPEAQEYLKKFELQINDMIKEAPILAKRRQDGLKQLPANEAPVAKKAIEDEKRAYEEALRQKIKWREISKYDDRPKGGLQVTMETIGKERAELGALNLQTLQADSDIIMAAIHAVADKDIPAAMAAMDKATKIQNQSYRALLLSLNKQLLDLRKAANDAQKAAARPASASSTASTEGDKPGTNPVAAAMKKLEEEKQKKTAGAGKDGKTADGESQPTPPPAAPEPPPSLMDRLNEYLPLIGGGLLVVIALAWFLGKRKKQEE